MAKIVLGMGTSHGPMLSTPPDLWHSRVPFDKSHDSHPFRGKRYTFDELVALRAGEDMGAQITPEKWRERHAACRAALTTLADVFAQTRPDVAIIVGNDQKEVFTDKLMPAFVVFRGRTLLNVPLNEEQKSKLGPGVAIATPGYMTPELQTYPGVPDLADHITRSLMDNGFDMAVSDELPSGPRGCGVPHAFGFVYRQIMRDAPIPTVPLFVNTFYPPNQPSARRCFDFGVQLKQAVESFPADLRVAIFASGGLTHFVIDETLDRKAIEAMRTRDVQSLTTIPEELFQDGTSELKNWIPVAGAMSALGLDMTLVDYVPCYRSMAGTGNAMGFAYWR
jgi:3-O-methylgallate 3,4-dioxygenase